MSRIPIQNIYYLLCYAWDRLEQRDLTKVTALENHQQADLMATVLSFGVSRLLRRGLARDYIETSEDTSTLRGRVDFNTSLRRFLLQQARAHCRYDHLSPNILPNRILKATMRRLTRVARLDQKLKKQLRNHSQRMGDVDLEPLSGQVFRRMQFHRNNGFYVFLMHVCELVFHSTLVDEKTGDVRFLDFLQDKDRMPRLFEHFLFNFFRLKAPNLQVKRVPSVSVHESAVASGYCPDCALRAREAGSWPQGSERRCRAAS